ncbi:non-ribosomal peptide synthase/polyketide synthase [Candidatus Parabeggiatoa sp. HSG14]|uniref:non-ribosomal peptide synthase/polyketide synthase n=1 Tax=Candidatus Parabeggiatoa sp. HSG14 TaxID=3055593 RepID=UPI0025A8E773|nr:non-ribosomal peptide synthase/polyketide synthase [Thiotrichales bacterium HSG14]
MNDITERLAKLSPERRQLVLQKLREQKLIKVAVDKEHQAPTIVSISREQTLPLSFSQQRLWFLDQLEGEEATYKISTALRLEGRLDRNALEQSLAEVVQRHETLRTTFQTLNGEPIAQLSEEDFKLTVVDLQDLPGNGEAEVQHLAILEAQYPFELAKGPLFRATLWKLGPHSHVLGITMHHIISDGWSMGVFAQELSTLYNDFSSGKKSPLPPLPIQYVDFAHWQRQWLTGDVFEKQVNYWKQQLADAPALLQLPTDRPRQAIPHFQCASVYLQLTPELTAQLKKLSQLNNVTLFMTLLAAFATLMSRYSGMSDLVIGSPIANRTHHQIESLIGFFLNTLALRINLEGNPRFSELLQRVQQVALEGYAHQDLPFEKLIEELHPERTLSHTPLFQVLFVLQNTPETVCNLRNLTVTELTIDAFSTPYDFDFNWIDTSQGLMGLLTYNTNLFNQVTMERMLGHFQTLLEDVVTTPEKRISTLRLLTEAERHHQFTWGNRVHPTNAFSEFPKQEEQSIPTRFEQQVEQYPHHIAVKTQRYAWTYRELNDQANQIAQVLLELSKTFEERIALLFEHDAPMLAGMMGVLKAGKTYVPLDPYYPYERLKYILQDSQASAILTNSQNFSLAQTLTSNILKLINIDDIDDKVLKKAGNEIRLNGDNLAYILYTSGSTGQPKGVIQNHRNVMHFIRHYTNNLHITTKDRLTLLSSYSFDAAVMGIFGALLNGATIYPINLKENDIATLSNWLIQEKMTIYHSTPTVYRHFLNTLTREKQFPHIRLIVLGGEAVYKRDLDEYKRYFDDNCIFINGLGPTESTVTLQYFLNKDIENTRHAVPVGYPIAETEVLLLDDNGEVTEIYGEIAIRSPYVALGYWQKPELTRSVFLPDPDGGNRRIYRMGDMGRLLSDGSVEFVGRKDFQIKLRGFRIELGEIEAVLTQHPSVQETVVIMVTDETKNEPRIIAYLVATKVKSDSIELRQFLKEKLPDYMIPSAFISLEAMPLTPTGKIDRRQLSVRKIQLSEDLESFVAPRTPEEELLAGIWALVLGIERVGIRDNFFGLGGHSLLATQLMSRIRDTFSVEVQLRTLFESPTVAELGETIRTNRQEYQLPSIQPVSRNSDLELSFAQQRLWFLAQLEGKNALYNLPGAVHLKGVLHIDALKKSLIEIVQRHESLRTTFSIANGKPIQVIHTSGFKPLSKFIDLQHLSDKKQTLESQRLIHEEAQCPFDIAQGPLLRTTLIKLSNKEYLLQVTMHHIISDGWSIGLFIEELSSLYNAFSQGKPSPLSPLPIQYVDFAHWQRQWLAGDILETQLNYWQKQMAMTPALLELPTDKPRPSVQSFQGATERLQLSPELTEQLKTLSLKTETTLFMTLLSAFATLLSRYTGSDDIVIGSPIANRIHSQTESLIGFFVNTLVLRTDLQGNPSFSDLLQRVRQVALDAYAHQDIPFEQLVEVLQPERSLSHAPLFQVMFALQNAPMGRLTLSGLTWRPVDIKVDIAKFDLSLFMFESEQGLQGHIEYNTDLFEHATITRIIGHFQTLLNGIVTNPEQCLSELPLLTAVEQQQLQDWNNTTITFPQDKCLHQEFESQVLQMPDVPAVIFENQPLSYAQLNKNANQLAHELQKNGVKPNVLVGLCVERSFDMVIGLLGILKAGGAYIPLDPAYPKERLAFMLSDSQASVLLTQTSLLNDLPETKAKIVCLDTVLENLSQGDERNPVSGVTLDNLAYVIYTSGSTGQPKGVAMEHRSLHNLIFWQQTHIVAKGSRTLQFAPISFDVSFQEIFSTWCVGGALVLVSEEIRKDAVALLQWLQEQAIENLFLPFVALQQLAEIAESTGVLLKKLRHIVTAGEQLQITSAMANWLSKLPDCTLHNHYGPSESHVVTAFTLPEEVKTWPVLPSIGKPIANTQIYLLDADYNKVPIGIPGELYIGGLPLARGYLNRPDMTAKKFINIQLSNNADEQRKLSTRLYKTGDLARYLPDGNLEFLGRIDNQVKIRGFRIELGEIEAILAGHPSVRETVVIDRTDTQGTKRLIAYLVPTKTVSDQKLRRFIKEKLPEYMLPSAFVRLDVLPLTPSGKIDRRKLPDNDLQRSMEADFVAAKTPTQEIIAAMWANVLNLSQVGIFDNFFELGGHSLLATQVVSKIRDTFSIEIPVRRLFESPTVAGLSEYIDTAHPENQHSLIPPLLPVSHDIKKPLSFAQQRLWFLDQLEGASATYHISTALHIKGVLNVMALQQSFTEMVQRHEVLRTNFTQVDGVAIQVINPAQTLSIVEVHESSSDKITAEVTRLATTYVQQPFDLGKDALLRVVLLALNDNEHVLVVTMHHIISDGWSINIFLREFVALYKAFSKGELSPLVELPVQYADFSHWQRQWLSGEVLETQINYWKQQLANAPPVLELPTDRPRPPVQTFRGRSEYFELNNDLSNQLKTLSQQSGVTLFMTLLASFATLLSRYSGQENVVMGAGIANRNHSEIEALIGFFTNTLVMRTDLSNNPSFETLLIRVRQMALEAYGHQDVPFEKLVEELQPKRDMSHTPIFQVMFAMQGLSTKEEDLQLPDLTIKPLFLENVAAKFDLTLYMDETPQGLVGALEYNTDLFDTSTIKLLLAHFQNLLAGIVANPAQRLSDLPLLSETERHQILVEWNNTYTDYPYKKSIPQLFEAQVEKTPETVAVVFADQQLTYQELNVQANQLAHHLQTLGIGADVLVGLCVERSLEMVIGVLGILKTGGAYFSLDSSYPKDNLAFMLEDSQISVLLTEEKLVNKLPEHNARVVFLENIATNNHFITQKSRKENLISHVTADNLAYVSYTSGSTGRPKGVCINQRSVIRLVKNTNYASFTADQIFLQFAPLAFDASTLEIWGPLLNGAKLIIMPPQTPSLEELGRVIRQHKVTTLWLTAGLFNQMVDERLEDLSTVRQLLAGGDVLSVPHVRKILRELKDCQLINGYGPTENTTFTCCFPIVESQVKTSVPIGRPIANTQVYILDKYFQPVPIGIPGELHIGGDGLARGYLNRPELTAEKFILNPYVPNSRLYKTGDLVRYQVDGNIEFLGRFDNQVKIRGFRIELGEIETVLAQHPVVLETIVIVREYQTNDKRLVAYIVPEQNTAQSTPSELLRFLKEKLPDYMVPSALVMLDALPLNPNGKVERNALPAPENSVDEESYIAPRTPTEEILGGLFANILKLEQVGIQDNFFERGGHSLLATQLISRIRDTFAVELPLRDLFESPTIADLVMPIEAARQNESIPPIQAVAREGELPLSFAQERLWFLNQLEPNNPFYNMPIALRLRGSLSVETLKQSLQEIVQRHESLRTTFGAVEGHAVQIISPTLDLPFSVVDCQSFSITEQAEKVQRLITQDAGQPFDLAKGPLIRASLLRVGVAEYVFLLNLHHIISDGWSMGVLIQELTTLYTAFSTGAPSPFSPLPIQYSDFATWQREWFQGTVLEKQLSYWKQQLTGASPLLKLPKDRPRPAVQTFQGGSERIEINKEVAQSLKTLSRENGATLFMTLLAAFAILLYRYSDQDDIVIGSPIANRNRGEMESLIGFFVNTLALRIDLSSTPTFVELLKQVQKTALDAYTYQDLPFEKLVDELQIERDLSQNPLFQVMFALQNAPMEDVGLPGLTSTPIVKQRIASLFDLVFDMWEVDSGLVGVLEYNTDLFDATTIVRMLAHFQTLLAGIAINPKQPISELPLLTEVEKSQLLSKWNGTRKNYPVHKSIHSLFETQVEITPNQVAAVHADQHISYIALNKRANQIAHWLRRIGIKPNDFVGILEERGIDFLAAMLGILKAGSAFLPIDPSYPDDRVQYMVTDSQIHTLITRGVLFDKIATEIEGEDYLHDLLCFDDSKPRFSGKTTFIREIEKEPTVNTDNLNEPTDIAYMLYTSGSTGLPKGTMVRHNGAVNHIYAEFDELAFHQNTAFLQSAPSSSDISVWQFLAPILIGGHTVIVDFETICDPVKLFKVIKKQQVTLIELVPVVMQGVLEHIAQLPKEEQTLPALEWAMVTGEAVSPALVNQWLQTYPNIKLVNAYGPTEAADDICQAVLDKPLSAKQLNVPIGKPIANLSLYVLDRHLKLQPIGVYGEICVSGIGVGAGYWRNEERTRANFVNNPYADELHGETIYRTGDLGRWLPDGSLEFIGRLDHQVKIRGFRIELGEIEGVLSQYPAVRETIVIDREDEEQPGDKRLVAYLIANMQGEGLQAQIKELHTEQVSLWQDLHEDSYGDAPSHDDPTFNIIGWDSTYTGQQLPDEVMHERVDTTIDRILSLQPENVLEIGCGTGLLMYRIVPHCKNFVGTDLSSVALKRLEDSKSSVKINGLKDVTLLQKMADDFEGFETDTFDTLVMNSVVQYFPSIDYLLQVLKGSFTVVKTGGSIFIGDVRSLPLIKAYHASVQFSKAEDSVTQLELEQHIRKQMVQEQELAIAPAFFIALKTHFPQISHVEIQPEHGVFHNEMTRFRYDVILHLKEGENRKEERELAWLDWSEKPLSLSDIRQRLVEKQPPYLALRHVANARLSTENKVLDWLVNAASTETVAQLRDSLSTFESKDVDPEKLWQLTQELPYDIHINCSVDRTDGSYDVIFRHHASRENYSLVFEPIIHSLSKPLPITPDWNEYTNNPLQEKFTRKLLPQLRGFLKEKLPQHMIPTDFVFLETFPLMPNGKVDREALPAPDTSRNILTEGYIAPSNPIEEGLATIWAEVLGLEKIGIHDNFFELGGHSLKATQVISRIHKDLGIEIAVRDMFNLPTIAELAIEMNTGSTTDYLDIERIPDAVHYPISHAQRRLWVLAQMEGGSAAYHMASALLLKGKIEQVAFERAFITLVERHESLRTTFISVENEPRQQIHSQIEAQMGFVDLTTEVNPQQRAEELALEDTHTEFDLENGPLIRMSLLKLADNQFALLSNMHHIISDGWSLDVLSREFLQLYVAFCQNQDHSLPDLRIHYRDYAHWQNNLLQSDTVTVHQNYWHEKLAGEMPVLNLPTDFPRPPVKTYNGKKLSCLLATPLPDLQNFNRQHNVSLFMTLVALVNVLFYRYTEQKDIIVGSPVAGRDHADLENQIGFYVNTLVLRSQNQSEMSFADFLQQIKSTTLEAYEHQIYPFDRLVQDLNLHRDVSRSPLFDVMVVMQNIESVDFSLENIQFSPLLTKGGTSQFDLTLSFEERHDGLHTTIWYNTDLFLEERIVRLTQHFETLVASILTDANQPIARLNILPKPEQQKLLYEFNGTTTNYPRDKSLIDLFVAQASITADAVAVTFETQQLTYSELNAKANQLAHHLIELGIGANVLVGLCVERSLEMVVGILGILKAGGAYVPLDPTYPAERLAFMLEDSQVPILLTQQKLEIGNWKSVVEKKIQVVYLDSDWPKICDNFINAQLPMPKPEDIAYVIYTSGSTGKPKGVLVTHANVARLFSATQSWYHFNEKDVWTLFHSYAFDFSVWELWGALLYGGRLVVVPYLISRSPEAFYDLVDSEGVTVLNQTPSAFRQLIQVDKSSDVAKPLNLRTVIFGGEALDIPSLRPWFERHGDQKPQLVNMYGITETTVHVTYRPLSIADLKSQGSAIGCAIPDLQVYILDQYGQPVPIGVPGELHVGGAGLAQGYLNRPTLTAEKFILLTMAHDLLECRLYKTGDLARYLSNGDIEYLGRIDNQVKIRGFRIELGEIETVLTAHPAVQESIVMAQKQTDDARLIAYLNVTDQNPNIDELRRFLTKKLPDYMVPATFVMLEAFPLTPSGKVDIRALPVPDQTRPEMETTYIAPQSELERVLATVWQEMLGVEKVGIQDNVFDLGAHSVLIIEVRKKLKEILNKDIPVVQLFKYPTIGALAEYFSQTQNTEETKTTTVQLIQNRAEKRQAAQKRRKQNR